MIRNIIFFFILINLNIVNASPNIEIANNFKKISEYSINEFIVYEIYKKIN